MSDEITISSGGAIAVDSAALRDIAARLGDVARQLVDARDHLARARGELAEAPDVQQRVGDAGIPACIERVADLGRQIDKAAGGTTMMADTFEVVELRTAQDARGIDSADAAALQARIDELLALPGVADSVVWTESRWARERIDGPVDQPLDRSLGLAGGLVGALSAVFAPFALRGVGMAASGLLGAKPTETAMSIGSMEASRRGLGVLPLGTTLQGAAPKVIAHQVAWGTTSAPASLTETISRVPYHQTGQVVIEKYTMKDGERPRFVTYIDGTRTVKPGTSEPWDMGSNIDMYLQHEQAASQQAVLAALEAAGAEPGDQVDLVGYSQGAEIASFIAMESPYETGTVIVAGDPTQPSLSTDQTLVDIRHRGDVVSNLAAGGAEGGTGSPESFEVIREPDRDANPVTPHDFEEYLRTADLADRSGDPRVSALQRDFFGGLVQASNVERMEFTATRE